MEKNSPYVSISAGNDQTQSVGWFILDTGANSSYLDPTALDTLATEVDPLNLKPIRTHLFGFFEPIQEAIFYRQNYAHLDLSIRQAGLIGTDFLNDHLYLFDYKNLQIRQQASSGVCSMKLLRQNGYRPMSTAGFFTKDQSGLYRLKHVNKKMGEEHPLWLVPNIPTFAIKIGKVKALAQLDTGYNDSIHPLSININTAFMNNLLNAGIQLVPDSSLDLFIGSCVGIFKKVQGYRLPDGVKLSFIDEDEKTIRSDSAITIYLKDFDKRIQVCGGISSWTIPAAQLGASFAFTAKGIILDAPSERVWMLKADKK